MLRIGLLVFLVQRTFILGNAGDTAVILDPSKNLPARNDPGIIGDEGSTHFDDYDDMEHETPSPLPNWAQPTAAVFVGTREPEKTTLGTTEKMPVVVVDNKTGLDSSTTKILLGTTSLPTSITSTKSQGQDGISTIESATVKDSEKEVTFTVPTAMVVQDSSTSGISTTESSRTLSTNDITIYKSTDQSQTSGTDSLTVKDSDPKVSFSVPTAMVVQDSSTLEMTTGTSLGATSTQEMKTTKSKETNPISTIGSATVITTDSKTTFTVPTAMVITDTSPTQLPKVSETTSKSISNSPNSNDQSTNVYTSPGANTQSTTRRQSTGNDISSTLRSVVTTQGDFVTKASPVNGAGTLSTFRAAQQASTEATNNGKTESTSTTTKRTWTEMPKWCWWDHNGVKVCKKRCGGKKIRGPHGYDPYDDGSIDWSHEHKTHSKHPKPKKEEKEKKKEKERHSKADRREAKPPHRNGCAAPSGFFDKVKCFFIKALDYLKITSPDD